MELRLSDPPISVRSKSSKGRSQGEYAAEFPAFSPHLSEMKTTFRRDQDQRKGLVTEAGLSWEDVMESPCDPELLCVRNQILDQMAIFLDIVIAHIIWMQTCPLLFSPTIESQMSKAPEQRTSCTVAKNLAQVSGPHQQIGVVGAEWLNTRRQLLGSPWALRTIEMGREADMPVRRPEGPLCRTANAQGSRSACWSDAAACVKKCPTVTRMGHRWKITVGSGGGT